MKHAPNTPSATILPAQPANGLTAGLDWAKDDHAVCVVDATGAVAERFTIEHTSAGLRALVRGLGKCRLR
jgi:transposase